MLAQVYEQVAVQIEMPFGHDSNDLPLDSLCVALEADVLTLLDLRLNQLCGVDSFGNGEFTCEAVRSLANALDANETLSWLRLEHNAVPEFDSTLSLVRQSAALACTEAQRADHPRCRHWGKPVSKHF